MMETRLDSKQHGSIILVMQRLHQNDLSGHLIVDAYLTGAWSSILYLLSAFAVINYTNN
jgi:hypothetical protein